MDDSYREKKMQEARKDILRELNKKEEESPMSTKYMNQWFNLDFNGVTRRAKCIDIEFEGGTGPQFLMQTKYGNQFWLSRGELNDHVV